MAGCRVGQDGQYSGVWWLVMTRSKATRGRCHGQGDSISPPGVAQPTKVQAGQVEVVSTVISAPRLLPISRGFTTQQQHGRNNGMLVLSRTVNERIVIDGGIVITIVKVQGDKVRIGIDAPKNVGVNREEVAQKKLAGNGEVK